MKKLNYIIDDVLDFFSYNMPHSVLTWLVFIGAILFILFFAVAAHWATVFFVVMLVFLIWIMRYDQFYNRERIIAAVSAAVFFIVCIIVVSPIQADAIAAEEVNSDIAALPSVIHIDAADEMFALNTVRTKYDALTDSQKKRVTLYPSLEAKESAVNELLMKKEAEEEAARIEAERKAKEEEEKARKAAEKKAQEEAEAKAKKEAEEQARKEEEERKAAEEQARREAEEAERQQREAEEKAAAEEAERQRKEAAEESQRQRDEERRAREEAERESIPQRIVVVTPTGKKFHTHGCRTLRGNYTEMTVEEAQAAGYTACNVCNPLQSLY